MSYLARLSTILIAALAVFSGCAPQAPPAVESAPAAEQQPSATATPLIAIKNARVPMDGVLSGGQPTAEQIEQAAQAGYRTVVNLRTPGEEGSWDEEPTVVGLGMRYIAIPVAGADGISVDNARKLKEVLDDDSLRPMVLHCGSGNRIGALVAMKAFHLEGEDAETALGLGKAAGLTRLEPVVRERLDTSG